MDLNGSSDFLDIAPDHIQPHTPTRKGSNRVGRGKTGPEEEFVNGCFSEQRIRGNQSALNCPLQNLRSGYPCAIILDFEAKEFFVGHRFQNHLTSDGLA